MKHQWLAYVIVAILSIGAGVAIAGLPDDVPVDATIVVPVTTGSPETTLATTATTTTTVAPETTAVPTTEVSTTTTAATTTVSATTTTLPLPDRSEIATAAANGSGLQGSASRMADFLETLGYVDVTRHDGTEIVDLTIVYYADGFEESAARMAEDLDLLPEFIAPIAEAPPIFNIGLVQLLAYVGLDRG
jgi:hypothetical protein